MSGIYLEIGSDMARLLGEEFIKMTCAPPECYLLEVAAPERVVCVVQRPHEVAAVMWSDRELSRWRDHADTEKRGATWYRVPVEYILDHVPSYYREAVETGVMR